MSGEKGTSASQEDKPPINTNIHREPDASTVSPALGNNPANPSPPPSPEGKSRSDRETADTNILTDIDREEPTGGSAGAPYQHTTIWKVLKIDYPEVAKAVISLCMYHSRDGKHLILRGRSGYYGTYELRREAWREGESFFEKAKDELTALQFALLDNLRDEGMKFASYDSLLEFLEDNDIAHDSSSEGVV